MNDENNEFVNTEEPIEVSDEERTLVLEALEEVKRGEVISHEEMCLYIDEMIENLKVQKQEREILKVGS